MEGTAQVLANWPQNNRVTLLTSALTRRFVALTHGYQRCANARNAEYFPNAMCCSVQFAEHFHRFKYSISFFLYSKTTNNKGINVDLIFRTLPHGNLLCWLSHAAAAVQKKPNASRSYTNKVLHRTLLAHKMRHFCLLATLSTTHLVNQLPPCLASSSFL